MAGVALILKEEEHDKAIATVVLLPSIERLPPSFAEYDVTIAPLDSVSLNEEGTMLYCRAAQFIGEAVTPQRIAGRVAWVNQARLRERDPPWQRFLSRAQN